MDKNIPHSFYAGNKVHFSALIEPTSSYAEQLSLKMNDKGYFICNASGIKKLQIKAKALIKSSDTKQYLDFIDNLNKFLKITYLQKNYDDRILEFLKLLSTCDCSNHTISNFADKAALSPSRLSHLFKEQIGVPLKSYILLYQMEQAFKELLNGKNITEVALTAGFDTPSHFAGTVKRMMGMPVSLSFKGTYYEKRIFR